MAKKYTVRSNRTLLELKYDRRSNITDSERFQSYLTGIEIAVCAVLYIRGVEFQSYLTGIEITCSRSSAV